MYEEYPGSVCDVEGIRVGQESDQAGRTGVTVVLCEEGGIVGACVRGAAPVTRETDLARPENTVQRMHAVCLCGGSAYGLDAAGGIMRALEEKGVGFDAGVGVVPIVGAAVLFDLSVGDPKARPDAAMGYRAAQNACCQVEQGQVGAGTGATCGKMLPGAIPHRGGIGTASIRLPSGAIVGAIVAVNALGDIYDPETGRLLAGGTLGGGMVGAVDALLASGRPRNAFGQNTTIGVLATNAKLDKAGANRLASVAHDGLALAIRPAHTVMDGDTLFALATGRVEENPALLQAAAVRAVYRAVINAVLCDD